MKQICVFVVAALLLGATRPGLAQTPLATPAAAVTATRSQSIQVQAGNGIQLQLPRAMATVVSADPDIARAQPTSPNSLFLIGVKGGHTTVLASDAKGDAIAQYDVMVGGGTPAVRPIVAATGGAAPASALSTVSAAMASAAQASIAQTVSGASDIHVKASGSDLILTGTLPTAATAQQASAIARAYVGDKGGVINSTTVLGSVQVNVRVRIVEMNRSVTRQLGMNWQALGSGNGWTFGLRTGAATAGAINPLIPLGLSALSGATAVPNQIGAGFHSGAMDVNNVVDALAADSLMTILAEPNLTAQSGETASFLAGGEFPIPVAGNGSNGTVSISVEFKQFGVSLALVPTVLSPTRINLKIRPEVSQLSTNGAVSVPVGNGVMTIPALTVRRAETTVELGSGQSFAIAGLLQRTSTDTTNALPGIGEVPVLGALFKSNDFQRGESELVIIVTPFIVQPVSQSTALRTPMDGFKPATDLDRILFGRQITPSGNPTLDAGFILK